MYEEKLQKFGLTSGEARVYIALIELGSSTVGPIVKKSKVVYSKIYEVLERLTAKGLVSYTVKEKTRYFQALDPARFHEYLEKKKKELEENKKHLDEILPFLKGLSLHDNEHEVEIFIGNKGIMSAYEILLDKMPKKGMVRFFYVYHPKYGKQVYDFYFRSGVFFRKLEENYRKKRIKWLGIVNRKTSLSPSSLKSKFMTQKVSPFPIPGNMDIGKDSVLITAWTRTPIAILIKSAEVTENFRMYFDSLWKFLENLHYKG